MARFQPSSYQFPNWLDDEGDNDGSDGGGVHYEPLLHVLSDWENFLLIFWSLLGGKLATAGMGDDGENTWGEICHFRGGLIRYHTSVRVQNNDGVSLSGDGWWDLLGLRRWHERKGCRRYYQSSMLTSETMEPHWVFYEYTAIISLIPFKGLCCDNWDRKCTVWGLG